MKTRPTIETLHLILRPFGLADASVVQRLAGDKAVASTTARIPHPYEDGMAEEWIGKHQDAFEAGELVNFAVTRRAEGDLIGAIGLRIDQQSATAELGYWIGREFWGRGYGTEAARVVVAYGFEMIGLTSVHSHHLKRNPASGRIMQKTGMVQQGTGMEEVRGRQEEVVGYSIARSDYCGANRSD